MKYTNILYIANGQTVEFKMNSNDCCVGFEPKSMIAIADARKAADGLKTIAKKIQYIPNPTIKETLTAITSTIQVTRHGHNCLIIIEGHGSREGNCVFFRDGRITVQDIRLLIDEEMCKSHDVAVGIIIGACNVARDLHSGFILAGMGAIPSWSSRGNKVILITFSGLMRVDTDWLNALLLRLNKSIDEINYSIKAITMESIPIEKSLMSCFCNFNQQATHGYALDDKHKSYSKEISPELVKLLKSFEEKHPWQKGRYEIIDSNKAYNNWDKKTLVGKDFDILIQSFMRYKPSS